MVVSLKETIRIGSFFLELEMRFRAFLFAWMIAVINLVFEKDFCWGQVEADDLSNEIRILAKKLKSENLKISTEMDVSGLKKMIISGKESTILFLTDIKAGHLLACILGSKNWEGRYLVFQESQEAYCEDDMIHLYKTALAHAQSDLLRVDFGAVALEKAIVFQTVKVARSIFGLEQKPPLGFSEKDITSTWKLILREAKEKKQGPIKLFSEPELFEKPLKRKDFPTFDKLEVQREYLLSALRTNWTKDLTKKSLEPLRPESGASLEKRRQAAFFFYDIKATGVLLALLEAKDRDLKDFILKECLDVFRVKDVVGLYEAAAVHALDPKAKDDAAAAWNKELIHKLARRTCAILDLEPAVPKDLRAEALYQWWGDAVRTAQKQGIYRRQIDEALKYIEKQVQHEK